MSIKHWIDWEEELILPLLLHWNNTRKKKVNISTLYNYTIRKDSLLLGLTLVYNNIFSGRIKLNLYLT